jgi:Protein of unknown function (DUF3313)
MSLQKFTLWGIAAVLCIAGPLRADDGAADVSDDGLELREVSNLRSVYARPGATLAPYKRIALLDCFVEFRKGWKRNYNSQVRGAGRRITDEDMERIKKEVAEEFRKVFTKELETDGGYEIVDVAAADVLLLRPAIINLVVTAPDKRAPGRYTTIVDSAGQMTLYLELYDSASDELIAKVVDPRVVRSAGGYAISNSARNKAEADRILRRWADILRDHLDAARATDGSEVNQ